MNREDAAKLWPIIKAFGEGVVIQYKGIMYVTHPSEVRHEK